MKQQTRVAGLIAGLLLALLAALIAWSTSQMRIIPVHAKVGPQMFPYFAAVALAIVGICFIIQALRNSSGKLVADTDETNWMALGLIAFGFIFEILFIKSLGFILASTVLFMAVAMAYGSRRYFRDIAIGLIITSAAYFGFTRLLNLQLPAGVLEGLI